MIQNPRIQIIVEEDKNDGRVSERQHPAVGAPQKSPNHLLNMKLDSDMISRSDFQTSQPSLLAVNREADNNNQNRLGVRPISHLRRFQTDKMIMNYYQMIKVIGKGSFGEVTKARDLRTNKYRAIKKIKKSAVQKAGAGLDRDKEYEILIKLNHVNIVKLLEFYQDDDYFYVVTEFCDGGELFDQITQCGNYSENMAADIIRQVLSAVVYCHQHNIVHRDLKPENLLLEFKRQPNEDNNVKVIDFGTSIEYNPNQKLRARLGTAYYIAPEVLKGEYDEKCDVWSCGVILYILLCGYPPFNGDTDHQIFDRIKVGKYQFPSPEWDNVSQEAKQLIRKMLEFDPKQRISAQEILQDAWIQKSTKKQEVKPLNLNSLKNLQNFHSERKLQASIFQYIANQLISTDEEQELRVIFQALDANGDGVISKDELRNGIDVFRSKFGMEGEFNNIDDLIKRIDIDGSGNIDIKEFITATMNLKDVINGKQLKQAFDLFDIDGNGQITKKELQRVLGGVLKLTDSQWDDFIKDIDIDKDGTGKLMMCSDTVRHLKLMT
ncbi:protein kinase domain containing protein [Stylonychia lemnae]|uniref:Calcium-dependent protein kinase 1 n=1 Tax=Stylonychia lemnae TaxID=5949 RepID=A0A078ABS3_STYLE|nr:protein kinase domain containing protein [Stylonychia lemnae]|eukprot:CDW79639.1 protein kinase domain containing protein [Stylonychia lemnae]